MPSGRRGGTLAAYRAKRRFATTPEPRGRARRGQQWRYTIQKHAARRLHYDLRLELDGVLKSWAITKGPSLDPAHKRLAVRTEDHPVDYASFEGQTPEGNYGAGSVLLRDQGQWQPIGDPDAGLKKGKLTFHLHGRRLKGRWALVRFRTDERRKRENWLLIKEKDDEAARDGEVTRTLTTSVVSGREIEDIAKAPAAIWDAKADRTSEVPADRHRHKGRRKPRPLPKFTSPALATLVDELPQGSDWLFEVKFDGYRAIIAASGESVRIYTRNGLDWTGRFPTIARALTDLDLDAALLDGEIVAVDGEGRSDFATLQRKLKTGDHGLSCFVFDLVAEAGQKLSAKPLITRKKRLQRLLAGTPRDGPIFYADHVAGDGRKMLCTLCEADFEGVIAKRASAPYRGGRGHAWLKIKCGREQEFVIIGWSPSSRHRAFASILLGLYENGRLRYAGRAGSGFSQDDLASLAKRFKALARKTPPLDGEVPENVRRNARWLRPELVAQIAFAEFTREGILRHGRFVGLRQDKAPAAVGREEVKPLDLVQDMKRRNAEAGVTIAGVRLTHPDKVLYSEQGLTKRDLAGYLEAAAERMLEHLADRLVSLVRCPDGRKECFFQRHAGAGLPEAIGTMAVSGNAGNAKEYLFIRNVEGLVSASQMGVLEFHIWGSRVDDVERPDRIVFDLDPDPALSFDTVKQSAHELRQALAALGLCSYSLLTGGKGIHVVVPIMRRYQWPTVKGFAKALAMRFEAEDPGRYVATMSKAKRKGRIFIDYFRNDRSASAIAPYSPRARQGAPVAWPIGWDELDGIAAANAITVPMAKDLLCGPNAWSDYGKPAQGLKRSALRALGVAE